MRRTEPETTDDSIPAPFDELPTIAEPSPQKRAQARTHYGDEVVPEKGAIPDPSYSHTSTVDVTVPEWALELARKRLREINDPDRQDVERLLLGDIWLKPNFRTSDGTDVVEMLLDA